MESDIEIAVIDHTSDIEQCDIHNVSEVHKETNKIESHVEIAVIDDTSDTDKCDISNVDKLQRKTNKRKDDVEELTVKNNDKQRSQKRTDKEQVITS